MTCWGGVGGLLDEEAHVTYEGEGGGRGGGRSMANSSRLGGGVRRKRRMGISLNATSSDACSVKWDDDDHPPKPWVGRESNGVQHQEPHCEKMMWVDCHPIIFRWV